MKSAQRSELDRTVWERRIWPKLKAIGFKIWPDDLTLKSTNAYEEAKITNKTVNDAALERI